MQINLPSLPTLQIVDIGANQSENAPIYAPFLQKGIAVLTGFEPNVEALAALNRHKKKMEIYLPYAIGDGNIQTYFRCQVSTWSSLLSPNQKVLNLFHGFSQWAKVVEKISVQTHRFDDLTEVSRVDYLHIDIQGGELMVFQNGKNKLADCLVIDTEVLFLPLYENQPLFSEVELYLRDLGFVFHKFHNIQSRMVKPLMNQKNIHAGLSQQVWADAIFIKNFMTLEKLSNESLLKYALILHDLYQSYDIALKALIEYDSRTGMNYSRVYVERILSA